MILNKEEVKLSDDLLIFGVAYNAVSSYFSWFYFHFASKYFEASISHGDPCSIITYWMPTLPFKMEFHCGFFNFYFLWFSCKPLLGLIVLRHWVQEWIWISYYIFSVVERTSFCLLVSLWWDCQDQV